MSLAWPNALTTAGTAVPATLWRTSKRWLAMIRWLRLSISRADVEGPLYAAARASGRTNLPDPARLCDFDIVAEAHATA